jgi:ureidoacrylate peracid hydrolase
MKLGETVMDDFARTAAGLDTSESPATSVVLPARPEALRLDTCKTALIVVDMQNAYASAGGYLDVAGFDISGAAPAVEKIAMAAAAARRAGIPVIFLQNGWDKDYADAGGPGSPNWHKSNAMKTMRRRPELHGRLLAKGGWDHAIVDALTPEPDDTVIPKSRYSVFFNTNMDSFLRARGIRNLVFTGVATNVCVESSLRDAFHLEYFSVVLEDATHAAGPDFAQKAALYNIETFFGWVSTVADFNGAISQTQTTVTR